MLPAFALLRLSPPCLPPPALHFAGTLLNAVLALQIVWYKGGGTTKNAGRRGKKKAT